MTYEAVSHFAATWGLGLCLALFAACLVYALWPGNQEKFDRAAQMPLEDASPDAKG